MTSRDRDGTRQQTDDVRRELSYDVDALNEKVNPARAVDRRLSAPEGQPGGTTNRVTEDSETESVEAPPIPEGPPELPAGSPEPPAAAPGVPGTTPELPDTSRGPSEYWAMPDIEMPVHRAMHRQVRERILREARRNPMATGLIAFGVGWLASSLLPATEKE